MKQAVRKLLSVAVLLVAAAAHGERPPDVVSYSAVGITTFAPTVATGITSQMTSDSLRNDFVQVEGDAIIALETGRISKELKSVVDKTRILYPKQTKGILDIEVVEMLVLEM